MKQEMDHVTSLSLNSSSGVSLQWMHDNSKRIPTYLTIPGTYRIIYDEWVITGYGKARSVTLDDPEKTPFRIFLPKSVDHDYNLTGSFLQKLNLDSEFPSPCHGITYVIKILQND